jgi:hypothetical protein
LNYGDSVQGTITNELFEQIYTFEGRANDEVTISMSATSGDLDPLLVLLNPDGEKLTENDDAGGSTNSRIERFRLRGDGVHTIIATRFEREDGDTTGDYELMLEVGAPDNRRVVMLDEQVEGEIDNAQPAIAYRFDGEADQVINIAARNTSGDLNPQVILVAPDGHEYARNDDESRRRSDALIEGVRLPQTGSYTVVVTRYQQEYGITEGEFELEITEADPADSPFTVFSRPLEYGSSESGTIGDDFPYHQTFSFVGRRGDIVTIEMHNDSGDLDPALILVAPQGRELLRNDDDLTDSSTADAAIRNVILPFDGFYTILATRYQEAEGETEGEFEVELTLEESSDDNEVRVLYAPLDPRLSGAIRPDLIYYETPFYVAGDVISDDNDEVTMQGLLTFRLPPLPPNARPESVELDLSVCREIGDGFRGLGDLTVYIDPYRDLPSVDAETTARADEVETLDECDTVDVSEIVRRAYEEDERLIQFRLAFEDGVNGNDETDYVWFDPRLTIIFEN